MSQWTAQSGHCARVKGDAKCLRLKGNPDHGPIGTDTLQHLRLAETTVVNLTLMAHEKNLPLKSQTRRV